MAWDSIPVTDLVIDRDAFTNAKLTKLRDNLESFHDHTAGKGKAIPSEGIVDNAIIGAKLDVGAVKSHHIDANFAEGFVASTGSDLSVPADTTDYVDTGVSATIVVAVSTTLLLLYCFRRLDNITAAIYRLRFKLDAAIQAFPDYHLALSNPPRFAGNMYVGIIKNVPAGTRTITPVWTSTGIVAETALVKPRRQLTVLDIGF